MSVITCTPTADERTK